MCRANFSTDLQRPIVRASVVLPHCGIGKELPFLIDTGADTSCITSVHAMDMGLHPTQLDGEIEVEEQVMQGVGGESKNHRIEEPLLLAFEERDEDRDRWSMHVEYLPGIEVSEGSPENLLGRDVLHKFTMEYDPGEGTIELERDNYAPGRYECMGKDEMMSEGLRNFDDGTL